MSDAIDNKINEYKSRFDLHACHGRDEGMAYNLGASEALQQLQRDYIMVPRSEVPEGLDKAVNNVLVENAGDKIGKLQQAAALLVEQMEQSDE